MAFTTHTHIRGLDAVVAPAEKTDLALGAADSVKRLRARSSKQVIDWFSESAQSVYEIRNFVEFKTTWHPIGS